MILFRATSNAIKILLLVFITSQSVNGNLIFVPAALTTLLGITADVTIGLGVSTLITSVGLLGPFALGLWGMAAFARDAMFPEEEEEEGFDFNNGSDEENYIQQRFAFSVPEVSSYSFYRKKRSLDENPRKMKIPVNLVDDETLFTSIYKSDSIHCGERMICEIAAKPTKSLHADELSILHLIKSNSKSMKTKTKFYSSKLPYERAFFSGRAGLSCGSVYPKCPFDGQQMLEFVRLVSDKYLLAAKALKATSANKVS